MVRMTDLVRGPSAPAKAPAPPPPKAPPARASAPSAPAAPPPPVEAETPPPVRTPRLNLRALANSEPIRPVAPAAPEVEAVRPAPDPAAAHELFTRLIFVLERARDLVNASDPFPWPELHRAIERAVLSLATSAELFWVANSPAIPAGTDPVAFHQARVAVLALRVGANSGLDGLRLVELGIAGALIDVGVWALADAGRRIDPTTPEYRMHAHLSADIVRRWNAPSEAVVQAILQHHELEQGQGYPQGLRGEAIHPYAKILALVDRYAALTGSGGARGRTRPHEAIRDIVRSKNEEFSPPLIKALLSEISVFPPGTPVRLNTGEYARVIGVNRNHPLRPRVEVVSDAKGHTLSAARVIDLAESPFVYITGPATEQS